MQVKNVKDLERWSISPSTIHLDRDYDVVYGGYGAVYKAAYDQHDTPVAVKKLRPAGNRNHRLRVAVVSDDQGLPSGVTDEKSVGARSRAAGMGTSRTSEHPETRWISSEHGDT